MFDPVELRIMEAVRVPNTVEDVGALHDEQTQAAVYRLEERGFLSVHMDMRVIATKEGLAALSAYHQEMKDNSKHEAQKRANDKIKFRKRLFFVLVSAFFALLAAILPILFK